jgi:hypothetical protein
VYSTVAHMSTRGDDWPLWGHTGKADGVIMGLGPVEQVLSHSTPTQVLSVTGQWFSHKSVP